MQRVAFFAAGLLALAAIVWQVGRFRAARRTATDPLQRMGAEEAFSTGLSLAQAGRHLAASPYFKRAAELAPDAWTAHENYANTLFNGAQESRTHLGKHEPAMRSSLERMAMIWESLRHTDEASNWTNEPADQALLLFQRAQTFQTFGFALDALVDFRKAAGLHPGDATLARAMSSAEARLLSGGAE